MNILDIIKNINISSLAANTNKTLNVIKKSIPVYKELRPYMKHEKSIFKNKKEFESIPLKEDNSTYNDTLKFFN